MARPSRVLRARSDRAIAARGILVAILSEATTQPRCHGGSQTENLIQMTMPETTPQPTPQAAPAPVSEQLVTLTDAAAAKVVELRSREGKSEAALRLFVKSGGCSGYSYGLAFDDRFAEDDRLEKHGDVRIVIDAFSVQHIEGAEIDYVDSLMGSGFAINNPNAVSSCACGSSFNTDGSPAKAGGCH
jgi:iron-sulfur cluster assembly protein